MALERLCFDEWRLEQQAVLLADKERVIQEQRLESASAAARAVSDARRIAELEFELASARAEIVTLGDRCAQAGELCSELEQRLAAASRRVSDTESSLAREREARRELQEALQRNRERTAVLERGRERFFARLVDWQSRGAGPNPHQVDLAQFIAELRAEIASLSAENQALQERAERAAADAAAWAPAAAAADPDAAPAAELDASPSARVSSPVRAPTPVSFAALAASRSLEARASGGSAPAAERPASAGAAPAVTSPQAPLLRGSALRERAPEAALAASTTRTAGVERAQIEAALLARFPAEPKRRYAQRLLAELFCGGRALRGRAAAGLVELAGEAAAPALIAVLRDSECVEARAELVAQIGAAGNRAALPVIDTVRRASHPLLRAAALEASLRLLRGDKPALAELLRASFEDADVQVRRRAAVAAAGCAGIELRGFLLPLLRDSDSQIRRIACASLAGDGDPATVRALLNALLDEDLLVRRTAARLLEVRLGRPLGPLAEWPEVDRRRALVTLRRRLLREPTSANPPAASVSAAERAEPAPAAPAASPRARRSREPAQGEAPRWRS